ncbi:CinA family protein [Pseudooceanicola sp. LIPI14-2-Ac024]|uniref:CinA family protein n=1 Tax=Pseudooceanicola sp. LIPI14-2-Ac024 TaxID=3344875 RepID=UPI0035D0C808
MTTDPSPETILDLCQAAGLKIATAESCTGGMVASALTAIPGSSAVVLGGIVAYANSAKRSLLQVSDDTLRAHGAVSEPCATEMAEGALAAYGADIAVSITGIAGPGGSEHKPEGRVCFGLARPGHATVHETREFGPMGRDAVRAASRDHALALLLRAVQDGA